MVCPTLRFELILDDSNLPDRSLRQDEGGDTPDPTTGRSNPVCKPNLTFENL